MRWPFVGRAEELQLIGAAISDPGVPGLVLAGAAGVGKTRLLSEAVRTADVSRVHARSVVATPATSSIPFGALASLLPAELPNAGSPTNLLRFAADALAEPAGSRRLVIGVDDAHVLDETSAGLLHQLVQAGQAFVLASIRTGEPAPEPITALWKDELVERVEVQALSHGEMAAVLAQMLGGQVESRTVQSLWDTTRGNMLFLRELVNAGLDTGALAQTEGVYRWEGEWVVAPRLVELVTHRIGLLNTDEHRALELVAYGEPLGTGALTRLVEPGVLETVESKGLLRVDESTEVYLAHPLYGEVLRSECPPLRARSWKRLLADAVEDSGATRNDDWLRIATWRLDAGVAVAQEILMSALRQAWSAFDMGLTIRLAQQAIQAGAGVPAIRVLWRALFLGQQNTEVEDLLAQWMLVPMSSDDRSDLVLGRAINLFWGMDEVERGMTVLRDAELSAQDAALREECAGLRALFLHHAAEAADCVQLADELLAKAFGNRHAEAMTHAARVMALCYTGRIDSMTSLLTARKLVEPWDDEVPFLGVMVDLGMVQTLLYGGRIGQASELARSAFTAAEKDGPHFAGYIYRVACAQAARMRGRPVAARQILREGLSRYRRHEFGWYHVPAFLLGELAHVEALLGNGSAAEAALREAQASPRRSVRVFDIWADLARPWVSVAAGDRVGAVELAGEMAVKARHSSARGVEGAALHDLVRLGSPASAVDRLDQLREEVRGGFIQAAALHARAAAARDGEVLDQVAEGFSRMGADLLAAEAAAQASAAHHSAGRLASGRASRTRSALYLDRCEGARTPAVETVSAPELTPRERDIAKLASQGLSNKEIAERLVLSKRTVDNHLHQIYGKLGISGRAALSDIVDA
ncbi:helix-turn-helix transcriptional regulator [Flindersiella endophytica]